MEPHNVIFRGGEPAHREPVDPRHSDGATIANETQENSTLSSKSHWASESGFEQIDGDIEGLGYNETTVDILAVPCIGASPISTWAARQIDDDHPPPRVSDPDLYGVGAMPGTTILTAAITHVPPKPGYLWIRQGIRKEVSKARVLLYRHRQMTEGMTISQAADDLIDQLTKMRAGLKKSRPLFFICHSVGGLVVKAALVKAKQHDELKPLILDCHGVTFFATPHRGSSYLSMPNLRGSIQSLLDLETPLPRSIADELRLGSKSLLQLNDKFIDLTSEIRVWSFYETVDSQLSGLGNRQNEVHFSAPITSIKSGLVGCRGERILSLQSDHASCASFGSLNTQTMQSYLKDLGEAIRQAETLSANFVHTPLRLSTKVKVELIGFYDDMDNEDHPSTRLYVSKHYLDDFLKKGPEEFLRLRLDPMQTNTPQQFCALPGSVPAPSRAPATNNLHIQDGEPQEPGLPRQSSPEIVVTSHALRPPIEGAVSEPPPNIGGYPRGSGGLTIPSPTTPSFTQPFSSRASSESIESDTHNYLGLHSEHSLARSATEPLTRTGRPGYRTNKKRGSYSEKDDDQHMGESAYHGFRGREASLPQLIPKPSWPNPMNRKFMWIHLPYNNPYWVKRIFETISRAQNRNYSQFLSNNYWASKHVHGRRANWHVSYVKSGCGFVRETSYRPSSPALGERSISPNISPAHFYLYLPYLHYDTYASIIRRRNIIKRRIQHGRARPVPQDIAELDSIESQVIWAYIGHDPQFNTRRTLDQYGSPALQDTRARDDDQMLYKLTKERAYSSKAKKDTYRTRPGQTFSSHVSSFSRLTAHAVKKADGTSESGDAENDSDEVLDGNVLMVDQLWLWAVDNTTLMTFFPKRESHLMEGPLFQQADLRNSIVNELNGDLTGRCENALDLAAFITLHAVTVLLDRASHTDLEIFQIFEEAIGILTERMTSSLKAFRMESYSKVYNNNSDSEDPEDNSSAAIKRRYQRELEKAERQNRENTSCVLELRDMENELRTMLNLFAEQRDAIKMMTSEEGSPRSEQSFTEFGKAYLKEALQRLDEYEKQAHDMVARVDATRKDYEKLQEMIQRQAQVDEVRWSRLQAELASSQNLSVMIFTTFTVIFLPLSFFTSVFGMNTQEWGGPDENDFPSIKLIGAISLPVSAFLIAITLLAAFSGRIQSFIKTCYQTTRAIGDSTKHRLGQLIPKPSKESADKRRRMREHAERRKQRDRESAYDFWGVVRGEARSEYQIPETNRKRGVPAS